ncbi:MAG: AAA family ATPase [Isosphaeraceae bacterium]
MKDVRNFARDEMTGKRAGGGAELPVASRREALEALADALATRQAGLSLLTGESGSGKTWLWRRLVAELPSGWRWHSVDLSDAIEPLDLLGLLGHGLGSSPADRVALARIGITQTLTDETGDGRSWILILENAESASPAVRRELLALIHGMESGQGFAAILLVGSSTLTRQLGTRDWRELAGRISTHVHLLPMDVEEARELAEQGGVAANLDPRGMELLHRDAAGNPRRFKQLIARRYGAGSPNFSERPIPADRASGAPPRLALGAFFEVAATEPETVLEAGPAEPVTPGAAQHVPAIAGSTPILPSRPPLRVEDGLVEVGWPGPLEEGEPTTPAYDAEVTDGVAGTPLLQPEPQGEEVVEDHYAALQAWNEWAMNRGRSLEPAPSPPCEVVDPSEVVQGDDGSLDGPARESVRRVMADLRAEPQHEHAPYSQLFSRLRQSS